MNADGKSFYVEMHLYLIEHFSTLLYRAFPVFFDYTGSYPVDVESHRRWYDYSRARDAMFEATDTPESPWYVINAKHKKRARLNCIAHLLSLILYEELPMEEVKLGKRQPPNGYKEPDRAYHLVPEVY